MVNVKCKFAVNETIGLYIYYKNKFIVAEGRRYCGVAMCQKVWGGGGGGAHRHVIFVPLVKNQYKRVVFGCMVI